jgi:hypothetical protein
MNLLIISGIKMYRKLPSFLIATSLNRSGDTHRPRPCHTGREREEVATAGGKRVDGGERGGGCGGVAAQWKSETRTSHRFFWVGANAGWVGGPMQV